MIIGFLGLIAFAYVMIRIVSSCEETPDESATSETVVGAIIIFLLAIGFLGPIGFIVCAGLFFLSYGNRR